MNGGWNRANSPVLTEHDVNGPVCEVLRGRVLVVGLENLTLELVRITGQWRKDEHGRRQQTDLMNARGAGEGDNGVVPDDTDSERGTRHGPGPHSAMARDCQSAGVGSGRGHGQ